MTANDREAPSLLQIAERLTAHWAAQGAEFGRQDPDEWTSAPDDEPTLELAFEYRRTSYLTSVQRSGKFWLSEWYWGDNRGRETDTPESVPHTRRARLPAGLSVPAGYRNCR